MFKPRRRKIYKQTLTPKKRKSLPKKTKKNIAISIAILFVTFSVILVMELVDSFRTEPTTDPPAQDMVEQTPTTQVPEVEEGELSLPLPSKTYAYVGEKIELYFLNLTGFNSLDDITVEVDAGGKGTIHSDRWEYTPKQAETINFRFTAWNENGIVVSEGTSEIQVKNKSKKDDLSLLVIGDSTVSGGYETKHLMEAAKDDGVELKLLGTEVAKYLGDTNNKHEGRTGWRAEHYATYSGYDGALNPFFNPTAQRFDFLYYMESQWYTDVDCVCIQVGLNDVFSATNDRAVTNLTQKYLENLEIMTDSIHEYDPDIKVVWNLILPCTTDSEKFIKAYETSQTAERYKRNTYLANLEIVQYASGLENVYVAPINAYLNTEDMAASTHGAVHPSEKGYEEIAAQLYAYLRAIN